MKQSKSSKLGVKYPAEVRAAGVKLLRESDRSIFEVATMLGVTHHTLRRWVRQAAIDEGLGPEGALTTDERRELRALRQEVKELKAANAILKKVEAFSASRKG